MAGFPRALKPAHSVSRASLAFRFGSGNCSLLPVEERQEACHHWAQKLYPQLTVLGVLEPLLAVWGSLVLVINISRRGQTACAENGDVGEGSWKLLVSEDGWQVLLSLRNQPEGGSECGGRAECGGKRDRHTGGPGTGPEAETSRCLRVPPPRDFLGVIGTRSIVPRCREAVPESVQVS